MTTECQRWMEFERWFAGAIRPELSKFMEHMASCQQCLQQFANDKNNFALDVLNTPDDTAKISEIITTSMGREEDPGSQSVPGP